MKRFRIWRGRTAALALLPVSAITIAATPTATGAEGAGSFQASEKRVKPNEAFTLKGRFAAPRPNAAPGEGKDSAVQGVRIQFRAAGADNWQATDRTQTGQSGKFSERVSVQRSGRFRAVSADGRATAPEFVRVKSVTRARLLDKTVKQGDKVTIKGHVAPAGTSRKVAVKVGDETIRTRTSRGGGFKVRWKADDTGETTVRVRAGADKIAAGSGDKAGRVAVLRPAIASYYGPGLYGNPMACGGTLQPDTVGVAHKSLPCGTKLVIAYGNRSVKTEVIDRGPYVGNREFDLTAALKSKLGFGSTGTVYVSK
jgi:rare lipoprotein A